MPQKVSEGCNERGYVGPASGIEGLADTADLFVRADKTHVAQDLLGSIGRVELDGESHEIEEHDDAPSDSRGPKCLVKESADGPEKGQDANDLASKLRSADGSHAEVQRSVSLCMLDGVTAFMRRDAQGRNALAIVILLTQHQSFVQRVVMIAEHLVVRDDLHIANARPIENGSGNFCTARSGA